MLLLFIQGAVILISKTQQLSGSYPPTIKISHFITEIPFYMKVFMPSFCLLMDINFARIY